MNAQSSAGHESCLRFHSSLITVLFDFKNCSRICIGHVVALLRHTFSGLIPSLTNCKPSWPVALGMQVAAHRPQAVHLASAPSRYRPVLIPLLLTASAPPQSLSLYPSSIHPAFAHQRLLLSSVALLCSSHTVLGP